jgi:Flp pilus assembly protein TadD
MPLSHPARLLSSIALLALIAASAAGCKTTAETTGSISTSTTTSDIGNWAERYKADPKDPDIAITYAQALRQQDQRAQAVAVLEQAAINNPTHTGVLGAYGRALADVGNYKQALDVLGRAHTPDQPDWRILSAQGAVLDQMGRHPEAQRHYLTALKIVPEEPSVLSNLGLSYALSKDLAKAEQTLKRAAAKPPIDARVRQNLALVVGLRGRFAEAESIARADLPPDEAAANVAYLKQMLAQKGDPRRLSQTAAQTRM